MAFARRQSFARGASVWKSVLVVCFVCLALVVPGGEKLIQNGQKLVFMGDSITEYGKMMPYGYTHLVVKGLAANGINVTWDGVGVRGHTAAQMLARFDADVLSKKPDVVTIASGCNDIGGNFTCEQYLANMRAMVTKTKTAGATPVVIGPTASSHSENNDDKIVQFAHGLKALAADEGIAYGPWYEMYRAWVDAPDTPALQLMNNIAELRATCDGCHMAPAGDRQIARATLKAFGLDADEMSKAEAAWNKDDTLVTLVPIAYGAAETTISVKLTAAEADAVSGLSLKQILDRGIPSLAAKPTREIEASDATITKTISRNDNPGISFKAYDQLIIAARKLGIRVDQAVQCAVLRAARNGTTPAASAPVAAVNNVLTGSTYAMFDVTISSVGATAGSCDAILRYGADAGKVTKTQRIAVGETATFISDAVEGLSPNTTYSYQLAFQNNATPVKTTILSGSFRTRPSSSAIRPSGNDDAATIQAAIAAASPNGTVVLEGGLFILDAELNVPDGVTLKGQGLKQTFLHQRAAHRVATLTGGAKLQDLTVEGGKVGGFWPIGGGLLVDDGTVSRCRVRRNALTSNNGFGAGVSIRNGGVDHSVICFNKTTGSSSGAGGIGYNDARKSGAVVVDTCLVYGNSVLSGNGGGAGFTSAGQSVTVRNSTIAGNTAGGNGGGLNCLAKLTLQNTVVSGNTAGTNADVNGAPASESSGNLIGVAKFVDAAKNNFRLVPGSPAIGYYGGTSGGNDKGGGEAKPAARSTSANQVQDNNLTRHEGVQLWANGPYFAKTNLGAEKESDIGYYYQWGSTTGYSYVNRSWKDQNGNAAGGTWYNGRVSSSLSGNGTSAVLAPQCDAVRVLWGGSWRMMTAADRDALKNNTTFQWTTVNGVEGGRFTGKGTYADRSIFLPNGGYAAAPGSNCAYYFTGSVAQGGGDSFCSAFFFNSGSTQITLQNVHRDGKAYPVRAVSDTAPGPSQSRGTPARTNTFTVNATQPNGRGKTRGALEGSTDKSRFVVSGIGSARAD